MSTDRYENNNQRETFGELNLLYMSASQQDGIWHSTPHAHQCTEMFYVLSGEGLFQIEDTSFVVKKNDMVIVNPNVEHTERQASAGHMDYMVTGFTGGGFLMENSPDSRYCSFHCGSDSGETEYLMKAIHQELKERQEHYSQIAGYYFSILCLRLLRHQALYRKDMPAGNKRRVCERVREYIDNHYAENITLDELAGIAHLNKYHLSHTFSKEFGLSPINYLINRRISESRYLLTNTNNSISQISEILGFSSPSYFTQTFQRVEGMSPKEYRRQMVGREGR